MFLVSGMCSHFVSLLVNVFAIKHYQGNDKGDIIYLFSTTFIQQKNNLEGSLRYTFSHLQHLVFHCLKKLLMSPQG